MKILFTGIINHPYWPGGEPRVAKLLASILSQRGHDVSIAFLPRDFPIWKIYPWSPPHVIVDSVAVKNYRRHIEKVKPDTVISWYDFDLSAFWGSVLSGTRTIAQAQTLWPVCPKADLFNMILESPCKGPNWSCGTCVIKQEVTTGAFTATSPSVLMPRKLFSTMQINKINNLKSKLNHASAIVSDSFFLKNIMGALNYNVGKVHVIYNGVDFKTAKPSISKGEKKTVLFLSHNISKQKGYHHFVQLSKNLKPDFPNVRFLWVGQKTFRGDTFEVIDYIWDAQELQEIYQSSYLLLLPSLWPEPMSYSVLQAMAHEKPVVAYDVGANKEAIIHNETGLLAEWGNVEQLTSHVGSLLLDEKLVRRMGLNAKKRVEENFSITRMTSNYENLLKKLK
jgi:glycosyltransferase involved in cell wall biosynthesis